MVWKLHRLGFINSAKMEIGTTANLQELNGTSFRPAPGTNDITGWTVYDQRGQVIGEIGGLLFNPAEGKIRYLIITLKYNPECNPKQIIVPVGLAESQPAERSIILPEVTDGQIAGLPGYHGSAGLQPDFELAIRRNLRGTSRPPYEHPQFYGHVHFNEGRFYKTGDLTKESAAVRSPRRKHPPDRS